MHIENSLLHYLYWCIEVRSFVVALSFALRSMKSRGQEEKEIHHSRIPSFATAVASSRVDIERSNRCLCVYICMSSNYMRLTHLAFLSFSSDTRSHKWQKQLDESEREKHDAKDSAGLSSATQPAEQLTSEHLVVALKTVTYSNASFWKSSSAENAFLLRSGWHHST